MLLYCFYSLSYLLYSINMNNQLYLPPKNKHPHVISPNAPLRQNVFQHLMFIPHNKKKKSSLYDHLSLFERQTGCY